MPPRSRWSSPFVLATAGTFAIHAIFVVAADAIVLTHAIHTLTPAPHVELVDVELAPPEQPIVPTPPPPPPAPTAPTVKPMRTTAGAPAPAPAPEPAPAAAAPPATTTLPAPVEQVLQMPDLAPSATATPSIGGGTGAGTGTGSGSGSGAGSNPGTAPTSIAAIKHRAMPRGDYSYFNAAKDYPTEASRLGIEGDVHVKLVVDDRGKVVSRVLLDHLGHGLDELALTRATAIEFTPARDSDDHPVASVVVWTFHMTVPK